MTTTLSSHALGGMLIGIGLILLGFVVLCCLALSIRNSKPPRKRLLDESTQRLDLRGVKKIKDFSAQRTLIWENKDRPGTDV